ncbi:uncharacterized protein [Watersipora subatra]|uniref:uncharacterized protein n=1 Tax=Watersipora subatra TaxID=2589382 RepID=UPI00355C9672
MDYDRADLQQLLLGYANLGTNSEQTERMREVLKNAGAESRYDMLMKIRSEAAKCTPIHRAAAWNDRESTRHMLAGFSTDQRHMILKIQNQGAKTAAHFAAQEGHTEMLFCLLHDLSSGHRFEILKLQDVDGNTALHDAAICKDVNALGILLAAVTPEHKDQLLRIKNNRHKTVEKISKLPELSYRYSQWNSLGLKYANQVIRELEEAVKMLTAKNAKQAAEIEQWNQRAEELEKQVPRPYDEISSTKLIGDCTETNSQTIKHLKDLVQEQAEELRKLKEANVEMLKMMRGSMRLKRFSSSTSVEYKQTDF